MEARYTKDDVIIWSDDPRLKGALDKACYIGESPAEVLYKANNAISQCLLIDINAKSFRPFKTSFEGIKGYYPAIILKKDQPQKSYEERQAEWIKENDIKVGDRVRAIRIWTNEEAKREGCVPRNHVSNDIVGSVGKIDEITELGFRVEFGKAIWHCPYFVLEKVTPKYVPFDFSKEEDRNMCKGRWVVSKDKEESQEILVKQFHYEKSTKDWRMNGCSSRFWLDNYTFDDGTPVGKEVLE